MDIEELSHVFNYNLPEVPETYVHRIGRTGRAGRGGGALSPSATSPRNLCSRRSKS
ncbi:MAG: helicase-related protein [Flavonifractor plautii]